MTEFFAGTMPLTSSARKPNDKTDGMMSVRENVPRPEYAAGQRRCKQRLDGGRQKSCHPSQRATPTSTGYGMT